MAKKILIPLDLAQNEIRNAVAQVLAAAPASPVPGQFYYDSTAGRWKYRAASAWIDPTDRATHSGTQLAATISDLAAYHEKQFKNQPLTYTVIASEKRINVDDLKKYGTVKKLNVDDLSADRASSERLESVPRFIPHSGPREVTVNRTDAIGFMGGAQNTNEECYLFQKAARLLGMAYVEHQARL